MQKVILITGVTSGFGKSIAQKLLSEGNIVYGTSRGEQNNIIDGVRFKKLDVTDKDIIKAVVDSIVLEQGRIDVLINNAGIGIAGAVELTEEQDIQLQMNTNFYGIVNMCAAVLPVFRSQGRGIVLNISSIGGIFAVPYQGFYSASKFAVEAYSEALALETKKFGVDVVLIEPGDFSTNFTQNRKVSNSTLSNDDYKSSFRRVLANIEKDEKNGGNPEFLAKKIAKIIESKNPRFRYILAPNFPQWLSIYAHKLLPDRLFQYLLRKFYSV